MSEGLFINSCDTYHILRTISAASSLKILCKYLYSVKCYDIVRGDRDSRANLMPIYGDLYQIKL